MGMIKKGTRCESKAEFTQLLRKWFQTTDEATIGEFNGKMGVTHWITVSVKGCEVRVNSDTTREAIGHYLSLASKCGDEFPWTVTTNQRGILNKVCIRPDGKPTKGLFMYTIETLPEVSSI